MLSRLDGRCRRRAALAGPSTASPSLCGCVPAWTQQLIREWPWTVQLSVARAVHLATRLCSQSRIPQSLHTERAVLLPFAHTVSYTVV